jgi:hypothetical protein
LTVAAAIRIAAVAVAVAWPPEVQPAQDTPFVVIVNKANPVRVMPLLELRRLFMKQTRMWPHADSVVPVDWDATSPNREAFSRLVLARTVREMGDYWVQQGVTQGLTPPSTQRSSRAILRFVASVTGAIAYVPQAEVDDTVAVVKITGLQQ